MTKSSSTFPRNRAFIAILFAWLSCNWFVEGSILFALLGLGVIVFNAYKLGEWYILPTPSRQLPTKNDSRDMALTSLALSMIALYLDQIASAIFVIVVGATLFFWISHCRKQVE